MNRCEHCGIEVDEYEGLLDLKKITDEWMIVYCCTKCKAELRDRLKRFFKVL